MKFPIADLHCDLTSYLLRPDTSIYHTDEIGCSLEHLKSGHVKIQVMAFYTPTKSGSTEQGLAQAKVYQKLVKEEHFSTISQIGSFTSVLDTEQIGMLPAIENASGFCEENESLKTGFERLEQIIETVGQLAYIGITHHPENRFGGGNKTIVGLKDDGKALLDYISEKKIPIDLSHTSDALAEGILNYITKQNLPIAILASHSNYRKICNHQRNLTDEFVQEVIHRNGIIGANFLRLYVDDKDPKQLIEHFKYGMQFNGGEDCVTLGADYFYTKNSPEERRPYYFQEHQNASCYPLIMNELSAFYTKEQLQKIAIGNVIAFYERVWS